MMASKSRVAQEALTGLEKRSAPFEEQLREAWKFMGLSAGSTFDSKEEISKIYEENIYHGREEWLLRWLLKKLQSPKDNAPRQTPSSWVLLYHLIRSIPIANVARILSEKKFITILRQTLQEAQEATKAAEHNVAPNVAVQAPSSGEDSSSASSARSSRKRKRSGEVVPVSSREHAKLPKLLQALSSALVYISQSSKVVGDTTDRGSNSVFSAEYMKTVLTTTAEESGKILGSWLSLSQDIITHIRGTETMAGNAWFSPFIDIWELHTAGNDELIQFSVFCSQPLLSLLQSARDINATTSEWILELDQLVARNIMIPAKAAKAADPESDLLNVLTRVSVIQDSANASLLFNVAIRSLQRTGLQRRRPQDNAWIQTVFIVLKDAMPPQRAEANRKAIQRMLESVIVHVVAFDLPLLRSVVLEYALSEGVTDWELLSTIIKLDANTFLIPGEEKDLLKEVLGRITAAAIEPTWAGIYSEVVHNVTIPLMKEFAKARDLSGFIRHWYTQLVRFEKLRKDARLFSMPLFSAWEDDTLQLELSKLLEPSLTVQQIDQLLDWLSSEVKTNPDIVCVILEAIGGSITHEDVIDDVGLRLYDIMFDDGTSNDLDGRYRWRSWRILSRMLVWIEDDEREELSKHWLENKRPFDTLAAQGGFNGLLEIVAGNTAELEILEVLRFLCAAWSGAKPDSLLRSLATTPMLKFLRRLANDIKLFPQDLKSDQELGDEICGVGLNTLYRGAGWMLWSFVKCIFVDYPEVLQITSQLPEGIFEEMLQNICWIASTSPLGSSSSPWLQINPKAFSDLWTSAVLNEAGLLSREMINVTIDTMLSCQDHINNPMIKVSGKNDLVIKSLLQIPIDSFSKKDRERIMKSWLPNSEIETNETIVGSVALAPDVLALKIKIMQRPTFYEGMKFADINQLADALGDSNSSATHVKLSLFKDLAHCTFSHMMRNPDQSRDRQYITEAFDYVQKMVKSAKHGSEDINANWNFASATLCEVLLSAFNEKAEVLNTLGLISSKALTRIKKKFMESLLQNFKNLLRKPKNIKKGDMGSRLILSLYVTIEALTSLDVKPSKVAELTEEAHLFTESLKDLHSDAVMKLRNFISAYAADSRKAAPVHNEDDTTTIIGRKHIKNNAATLIIGRDQAEKLSVLKSIIGESYTSSVKLDQLLAFRQIIASCGDLKSLADESNEALFDLSSAYDELCSRLWRVSGYRQFALMGETMENILRTKGRAITQWNIDSTLGAVSMICSRSGPSLSPLRSGSIYLHLCRLLQTILSSHRLKLEGHFHLVIQALQALLRCLVTPLPHTKSRIAKTFAPPPWLSNPKYQLHAKHAEAFTRLITLISNPSVSAVTRSQHNNLTSATDKAKRVAGQHVQHVLTLYIKLQLDMKMLPEVREKMVPGIYAIFDTTTLELRRAISEGLDSSGRAVYGTLYRDYTRFGKWKGP